MMFDPFGDFAEKGYLRNSEGQKDLAVVQKLEHFEFRANVEAALSKLASCATIEYADVLDTHRQLFSGLYPWAGQDRRQTAPHLNITKAGYSDLFAPPLAAKLAAEWGLRLGNDQAKMRANVGTVLAALAHSHPFLDGNGRTIMVVHAELCRRADIHIDWSQVKKQDYLAALTAELESPGKHILDNFLKSFVQVSALSIEESAAQLRSLAGLGPQPEPATVSEVSEPLVPSKSLRLEISASELKQEIRESKTAAESMQLLIKLASAVFADYQPVMTAINQAAVSGPIGDLQIATRLLNEPQSLGALAGKDGMLASRADKAARKTAIDKAPSLAAAAQKHIRLADGIRQSMQQRREADVVRLKVAISRPSQRLLDALDRGDQQLSADLKTELQHTRGAFLQRFGDELTLMRAGRDSERLCATHGIDAEQLEAARSVLAALDKGNAQVRAQERTEKAAIERKLDLGPVLKIDR